jgi:hypothetical protein
MHGKHVRGYKLKKIQQTTIPPPFGGSADISNEYALRSLKPKKHDRGYGGWGHPADQNHCLRIFRPDANSVPVSKAILESVPGGGVLANLNPFRWFK